MLFSLPSNRSGYNTFGNVIQFPQIALPYGFRGATIPAGYNNASESTSCVCSPLLVGLLSSMRKSLTSNHRMP